MGKLKHPRIQSWIKDGKTAAEADGKIPRRIRLSFQQQVTPRGASVRYFRGTAGGRPISVGKHVKVII